MPNDYKRIQQAILIGFKMAYRGTICQLSTVSRTVLVAAHFAVGSLKHLNPNLLHLWTFVLSCVHPDALAL